MTKGQKKVRHISHACVAALLLNALAACSAPRVLAPQSTAFANPTFIDTPSLREPPTATLLVGKQRQQAALGSWGSSLPSEQSDGAFIISQSCTLGIVTPREPLRVRSPFVARLEVEAPLQDVTYSIATARGKRRVHQTSIVWQELDDSPSVPVVAQGTHAISLNLPPGRYVLSFGLRWEQFGGQYGFLVEVMR